MALSALPCSILQIPFYYLAAYVIREWFPHSMHGQIAGLGVLFGLPTVIGAMSLLALVRSVSSKGRLLGWQIALVAMLISIFWPVTLTIFVLTHVHFNS